MQKNKKYTHIFITKRKLLCILKKEYKM